VASRVKTPRGEIDLVAKRGGVVAFVEVKWRARAEDLDRWKVTPVARLSDLAALPAWLRERAART